MSEPQFISKAEIDAKAKENKDKRKLPDKPGDNVSFREMKEWLALLSPDMTEGNRIIVYVYRADPVINNQLVDPSSDNNIDVISGDNFEHFTEEYMINRHGGGTYKFLIKDLDKPKETKGGYFEAKLTVPMIMHPPKLDLRTVDWDHKNNKGFRAWARAQKLIDENNMPVKLEPKQTDQPTNQQTSTSMVEAMKLAMDFAKNMTQQQQEQLKKQIGAEDSLGKSMGDILLEKMKQEDPNKQLATIGTILQAVKNMQPEQKGSSDLVAMIPFFIKMMEQQADQANKQFQLVLAMFQNKEKETTEQPDEITRLKNLLEVAKEIRGGGGTSHKSEVTEWIEAGAQVLNPILGIIQNVTAIKAQQGMGNTPNGSKPAVSVAQPPQSNIERVNQENAQHMKENQPTTVTAGAIEQNQAVQVINQYGPMIIARLADEGWQFAAWVAEGFGDAQVAAIAKFGVDGIMQAAKQVGPFWQQIEQTYGEAHLRKWVESFINYKEEMRKAEEDES